jgi:hypothetical protein
MLQPEPGQAGQGLDTGIVILPAGIEVKDRGRMPGELAVKFKAATGKQLREAIPGPAFSTPPCR